MYRNVLVVDDDPLFSQAMEKLLHCHGFAVKHANSTHQGVAMLNQTQFDLILLDRVFPQSSGLEVSQYMHDAHVQTPILMVSAQHDSSSRIEALEKHIDDFIAKPFDQRELLLKIQKLLQRNQIAHNNIITTQYFTFDLSTGIVTGSDFCIQLRRKEFQILHFLIQQKNTIVPKEILVEKIWGIEETPLNSTIDVHIRRVRLQIKDKNKEILRTIYGRGYQFYEAA